MVLVPDAGMVVVWLYVGMVWYHHTKLACGSGMVVTTLLQCMVWYGTIHTNISRRATTVLLPYHNRQF